MIILMRFIVSGHSMEPTFKEGQMLLVSGIPYLFGKPEVGDVVVVKDPRDQRLLLKRIIDVRPRRSTASRPARPTEEYFVSGDNPRASTDSKSFGAIEGNAIFGKVIFTLHTPDYEG